jgi:two-component system, NarL family, sensor kinase
MVTQEERIYSAIITITIVLGSVIIFFFIFLIMQYKRNILLQKESRQIEVNALEKERKRIAADLHDELAPMLAAIKMGINNIAEHNEWLDKTNLTINNLSTRMREISFDLMPTTLLRHGLTNAIEELASYINSSGILLVQLYVDNTEEILFPEEKVINIYRVIQEIIHNAVKHSKANRLKIRMYTDKNALVLATIDDGIGFDYKNELRRNEGIGLKSIGSRIDLLNGHCNLESIQGKGTAYTIEIPIE